MQPSRRARAVLAALADRPMPVLVHHLGRTVIAANPVEVIGRSEIWEALGRFPHASDGGDPMAGGLIGMLGYELAADIEQLPAGRGEPGGAPTVALGRFLTVAIEDSAGRWSVHSNGRPQDARELQAIIEGAPEPTGAEAHAHTLRWSLPEEAHRRAVDRARELIRAGDCYQINLASKVTARLRTSPSDFAQRLWDAAGANRYSAFVGLPEGAVVSASPERLLAVSNGVAITEPIKGTARLDAPAHELMSEKNRAEHVMIVDLMRNDLGRVARRGGVSVERLMVRQPTAYVDHLVSEVRAELGTGVRPADLVRAVFPGGSVTGAPKVRAMEVIRELEPVDRGPAYGSVLAIGCDGSMDASVAIRTAWVSRDETAYWTGGAIVWDSDPAQEFAEAGLKAAPFLEAVNR